MNKGDFQCSCRSYEHSETYSIATSSACAGDKLWFDTRTSLHQHHHGVWWFWLIVYTLEDIDIPPNPCETKHLNTQTWHSGHVRSVTKNLHRKDEGGKPVERTGRSQACGCNDMHLYKAFGVEDWSGDGFDLWGSKKMSVPWDFGVW